MTGDDFVIPRKGLRKQPATPTAASSPASSTPTPTTALTPTLPQPPMEQQSNTQPQQDTAGTKKKTKKKTRLIVLGAGTDDSFLYTLRAAGLGDYEEYVLYDNAEAFVGEHDALAQSQARLFHTLEARFGAIRQHDNDGDKRVLKFRVGPGNGHYIKYHYQRDPATLTPKELRGDLYTTAFARRPGLRATGAPGTYAPSFQPSALPEAIYLEGGRRVFVCEPPATKAGKGKGPLAQALPAQANVVDLSPQAAAWAARLPTRDRNVLSDVIAHESRLKRKAPASSDEEDDGDGRKKKKTPTKRARGVKVSSPAQAAKKKSPKPAAAAAGNAGKGKGKKQAKKPSKPKRVYKLNPFVR